jgi:hypothetical protein
MVEKRLHIRAENVTAEWERKEHGLRSPGQVPMSREYEMMENIEWRWNMGWA